MTALLSLLAILGNASFAANGEPIELHLELSTKGNDISFDQTAMQVPLGREVRLHFVNQAAVDSGILHNVVVLRPGSETAVIARLRAARYDLSKMQSDPDILAITATLGPGEDDTATFTPEEPGFYPYICLMPGHGDMLGMKGTLSVVAKEER